MGITAAERISTFAHIGLLNHDWANPDALLQIGTLTAECVREAGEILYRLRTCNAG